MFYCHIKWVLEDGDLLVIAQWFNNIRPPGQPSCNSLNFRIVRCVWLFGACCPYPQISKARKRVQSISLPKLSLSRGENSLSQESAGDISAYILLAKTTSHDHLGHMATPRMASAPLFPKRPLPDIWIKLKFCDWRKKELMAFGTLLSQFLSGI